MAPYWGQIIILSLVTLGMLFVALEKNTWSLLLPIPVMWLLFVPLVYFGLRYRVFWTNDEVCQQASGGANVCIKYDEVKRITSETSQPGEWLAASRPFRRIVIYADSAGTGRGFIDVSLKHFASEDIRELMRAIHDRRPELTLPTRWLDPSG